MIDLIFWGMMNGIGNILKFIVVFGGLGFLFLLPFLLKGGWIIGVIVGVFILGTIIQMFKESNIKAKEEFENKMKEREKRMNIFEYNGEEFNQETDKIFNNISKNQLKKELIECGLVIKQETHLIHKEKEEENEFK